jgi:hypothetical protein
MEGSDMGLIILQKKKAVVPIMPTLSEFAEQIDLFGQLTEESEPILAQIKVLQEKLKPLASAKAALQASINEFGVALEPDADDAVELGDEYRVEIGKQGSSRSIKDLDKIKELMGTELFMKVATVTLKDIDSYLTLPQREEVLTTARGSRTFKVNKLV